MHIIGILAFLNYLPYSKHLHILLAFPNAYYARLKPEAEMKNMPDVLVRKDTSVFPAYQALKRKNNPLQGMNVFSGYGRN